MLICCDNPELLLRTYLDEPFFDWHVQNAFDDIDIQQKMKQREVCIDPCSFYRALIFLGIKQRGKKERVDGKTNLKMT